VEAEAPPTRRPSSNVAVRYEIGDILARAADEGEPRVRLRAPETPPRCTACAFVKGTPANNTLETVLDAFGCMNEDVPFMCHQHFDDADRPVDLCSGWVFARESRAALQSPTGGTLPSPMSARETAAPDLIDEERSAAEPTLVGQNDEHEQ
jgi:hypothetical protein